MTPEEINRKCAEWAGRSAKFMSVNGVTYDQRCEQFPKDYYGSNAAIDLLGVLVERGYYPCLFLDITRKVWRMSITQIGRGVWFAEGNTIPAAICTAIIELIERDVPK